MASSNIARLGVVLGLDTAEFTASIDKAVSENKKLAREIKSASDAGAREIVALKYATDDYGKSLTKVQLIEREISQGRYRNATADIKQQLLDQAKAYDAVATSGKKFNTMLTDQQKVQMSYQVTDFATQVVSGGNPLIAMFQQGGQLKDQFGGVGNALKALGTLFTPFNVAVGAGVAALAAFGYAAKKGSDESARLRDDMILTGGFAGTTAGKITQLATRISTDLNVSIGNSREVISELVSSGQFTERTFTNVGNVIGMFAKLSGLSGKEAADKLIPSLDGSAASAKKLNDQFHFLTLAQYQHIEALAKAGKQQDAINLTAQLLSDKLKDQKRELGMLESAWDSVKNAASDAWDKMLNIGRKEDPVKRLAELNVIITNLSRTLNETKKNGGPMLAQEATLKRYKDEFDQLVAKVQQESIKADEKSKKAEADKKAIDNYAKAGGEGKAESLSNELDKLKLQNKFAQAKMAANEIGKIEIDAQEKAEQAKLEIRQKNIQENGVFATLNQRVLNEKLTAIEIERMEKIKAIRVKNMQENARAEMEYADEVAAAQAAQQAQMDASYVAAEQAANAQRRATEYDTERVKLKASMIGMTDREVALAQADLEARQKIAELEYSNRPADEIKMMREKIEAQRDASKGLIEMQDQFARVAEVSKAIFGNMESALTNFVRTGKLSFKDFANSVIQDLILIQLKASATKMMNSFLGSIGFNFGSFGGMRAAGGPVSAGSSYVVGERGPEVFTPTGSGTITPNHQLAQSSGQSVTNNYNIQAIDVKSFEQRLLSSAPTIWAANKYGEKNLAVGFGRA
jgi:lambda family phage tail tape measure protein